MYNHCLPKMYWLPKVHKIPIKARFIVAYPKPSIKSLAKVVTISAFQLFSKQIENFYIICRFCSGVNTFWALQNDRPVIDTINKLNKRSKAKSIFTFHFSTLNKKLLHAFKCFTQVG